MIKLKDIVNYYENFRIVKRRLILIQRDFSMFKQRFENVFVNNHREKVTDYRLKGILKDINEIQKRVKETIEIINKEIKE